VILVDSSVLIDYLEGRENSPVSRFIEVLDHGIPFGISPVTILEVLQGAATEKDFSTMRDYLGSQTVYGLEGGLESYAGAAKIFFDLRRKGMSVRSSVDCLIAQTAIEHGLLLLHNNSDFDRIAQVSSLKIYGRIKP
jgi:predicted nucleic acid-binding protein